MATNVGRYARVEYLDGVRGWASLVVVLSHLITCMFIGLVPEFSYSSGSLLSDVSQLNLWPALLHAPVLFLTDGKLAVFVFFVLSGFALSIGQIDPSRRNLALAASGRYFRLMIPVLFVSLLAYGFMRLGLFHNLEFATTPERSSWWLGTFYKFAPTLDGVLKFGLYDAFFSYDAGNTYNAVLWTMQIEILGSFLVYALIGIFRVHEPISWRVLVPVIVFFLFTAPVYSCFVVGYVLAELSFSDARARFHSNEKLVSWSGAFIFVAAAVISTMVRGIDQITMALACALVFGVLLSSQLQGLFSNRWSRFMGRISFPLYLVHLIVICSLSSYMVLRLPASGLNIQWTVFLTIGVTIVVSLAAAVLLTPLEKISMVASKRLGRLIVNENRAGNGSSVNVFAETRVVVANANDAQNDVGTLKREIS